MEEQMTKGFLEKKFKCMKESDWVIVAFRYYLGRMTIAAEWFATDLAKAWDSLPLGTKNIIQRELEDKFRRDNEARAHGEKTYSYPLGADMAWELVRKAYTK